MSSITPPTPPEPPIPLPVAQAASAVPEMPSHPAASLFPLMGKEELQDLSDDIKDHGQHDPIITLSGQILDGRNRYLACRMAGVEPRLNEWEGTGSPTAYVVGRNLKRRHLTPEQRAALAAEVRPLLEAEARDRQLAALKRGSEPGKPVCNDSLHTGRTVDQAAKMFGAGINSTQIMTAVREKAPEVLELAKQGKVKVSQAKAVAALPPSKRQEAVKKIKAGAKPKEVLDPVPPTDKPRTVMIDLDEKSFKVAQYLATEKRVTVRVALSGVVMRRLTEIAEMLHAECAGGPAAEPSGGAACPAS